MPTRRRRPPRQTVKRLEVKVDHLDRRVGTLETLCRTNDQRIRTIEGLLKRDGDLQPPG